MVGRRIRRLRQTKGFSRNDLARRLKVDVSSLAGWEAGKRLPRDTHRARLARALDCDLSLMLSPDEEMVRPLKASLLNSHDELPDALAECARNAKRMLKGARLASAYSTAAYIQTEWRAVIAERLLKGTIEVQRIEIFYTLDRLQEALSNILRYEGKAYHVKAYCVGLKDVMPVMNGYCFDDLDFFFGGYWGGIPPGNQPSLRISGPVIREFYLGYWDEVWPRGALLNIRGARDLSTVQAAAVKLGLQPRHWKRFLEEARELEIGDGAPPLV
jgi:transcriptional regulator with XRE-family HTH domain